MFAPTIALFLTSLGSGDSEFVYPQPADNAIRVRKEIHYKTIPGRELVFDSYQPVSSAKRNPVLIFMNAFGGPNSQRNFDIYESWGKVAAAAGFVGINPDTHAEGVEEDFDALVSYIREHAAELQADPERIAVYAASGHVSRALPLLQDPRRTFVKAAIIYYGYANMAQKTLRLDLPVLLVRAGLDRPGMNAGIDELAVTAMRSNAPFRVLNHPGGHHGFEVIDNDDVSRQVIRETLEFARQATEPAYHTAMRQSSTEARAASAAGRNDFGQAAELYGSLISSRPRDIRLLMSYGEALLGSKQYAKARQQFAKVKEIGGAGPRDLGVPAARAAMLDGDPADAIKWLESIPARFRPASLLEDPIFASIRQRPDFQALMKP